VRSREVRGARGSDWVPPRASAPDAGLTAAGDTGLAAAAGEVRGRARAAAQVTPTEEARSPRMLPILDIVI
jgi:hypothetical protein